MSYWFQGNKQHRRMKRASVGLVFFVGIFCHDTIKSADAWGMINLNIRRKRQPMKSSSRGFNQKYGTQNNNSSIPNTDELTRKMGLRPVARAPNRVWKFAWRSHGRLLAILHWRDAAKPPDADQSLKVIWNKAVAGLNRKSPAFDDYWTYSLLPSPSRWILRVLPNRVFPRLHHANIEIRTVYLNDAINSEIQRVKQQKDTRKIRIIGLGSGYDVRYTQLLSTGVVDEAWELDVPTVIVAKQKMLHRVLKRKQRQQDASALPRFQPVDFNQLDELREILRTISTGPTKDNSDDWHTIFVSEGVLIYLDPGIPLQVLKACKQSIPQSSLCFADLIREVEQGNRTRAEEELECVGWHLVDWLPKPGLARHMGICR